MKHLNLTEHIESFESFSKEKVILLYIYISLSKNALYINLDNNQ